MQKLITVDVRGLGELSSPATQLAPQDQTGRGDLTPDSPEWVWIPVASYVTPFDWWEGSDYIGKSVPAFIQLTPDVEAQ